MNAVQKSFVFTTALVLSVTTCVDITRGTPQQRATVRTIDQTSYSSTVDAIDMEGRIRGSDLPESLELGSVLSIDTGREIKAVDHPVMSILAGGSNRSQIGVESATVADETVVLNGPLGQLQIPLQAIGALVWTKSTAVQQAIDKPSGAQDRVIVQVGDRQQTVSGVVESIDADSVSILYKDQVRSIGLQKVNAVVFADVGSRSPDGLQATVRTTDGAVIQGVILSMQANQVGGNQNRLRLAIVGAASLEIDTQQVATINIKSDRLVVLSDLDPIDVRESTDFAVARSFQRNRSVTGKPLQIVVGGDRVQKFNQGIGMQATSRIDFENTNGFTHLVSLVGIDVATQGRGDCEVVVRVDGIEKWNQRLVAGEPAKSVDIDIRGSSRISLCVLPGREFDLSDHVNWCYPRLIKTE